MNYFERNAAAHAANDRAQAARRDQKAARGDARIAAYQQTRAAHDAQIVCPHCQLRGQVAARGSRDKEGVSGGKATAALLTAGASLLFVGLSRKRSRVHLYCRNCGMTWTA